MAKLKVAINGFGRIGRNFLRCWHGRKDSPLDVVVVNDSGGVKNVSKLKDFMKLPCLQIRNLAEKTDFINRLINCNMYAGIPPSEI